MDDLLNLGESLFIFKYEDDDLTIGAKTMNMKTLKHDVETKLARYALTKRPSDSPIAGDIMRLIRESKMNSLYQHIAERFRRR